MKSTEKKANKKSGMGSIVQGIAGVAIGAALSGIVLWMKKISPMEEKIMQMENEKDQLQTKLEEVSKVVEEQPSSDHLSFSGKRDAYKIILSVLAVALSLVGPVMVIIHRWLRIDRMMDLSRNIWCKSELLCKTIMPSYFLYFLISFAALILLIVIWRPKVNIPFKAEFLFPEYKVEISDRQKKVNTIIGIIVSVLLLVEIGMGLMKFRIPGPEYILLILGYVAFVFLNEYRWKQVGEFFKKIPLWIFPYLVLVFGVLTLLRSVFEAEVSMIFPILLMIIAAIMLIPHYRKIPGIMWLPIGGLFLFSVFLQSWRYAIIGDEYAFYSFGRAFLKDENLITYSMLNLLNPFTRVHGKFGFLSILPNLLSMEMFGAHNFGWRIVNIISCCFSIPFFYGFVKRFMNKRMAILFSILVISSHFLISFSKIGYNNLTAFFAISVLLWLTGKVLDSNSVFAYAILGFAVGLSLYLYTAILALLPLPFILVFLYNPPYKSRRSVNQWITMIIVAFLFFVPLISGADFWNATIHESTVNSGIIVDRSFHLTSNLLYSFFSPFYAPENSHFVAASFLDAISGALLLFGLIAVCTQLRKDKFSRFVLISYLFLFISLGISRDRAMPSATHFFLYLPIWWLIVVYGIDYLSRLLFFNATRDSRYNAFQAVLMSLIVLINLFQAFVISPLNSIQYYNHETLFLRFLEQADRANQTNTLDYLYLTDAYWNIYGLLDLQDVYQLPAQKSQISRSPMWIDDVEPEEATDTEWVDLPIPDDDLEVSKIQIESWAFDKLDDPETIVVTHPVPDDDVLAVMEKVMDSHDREMCEIYSSPGQFRHGVFWINKDWMWLCPVNGVWQVNW